LHTPGSTLSRRPRPLPSKKKRNTMGGSARVALAFLAPSLLALFLLRLLPAGIALVSGLFHDSFVQGGEVWVGFGNYINLFSSSEFLQSLGVTLLFAVIINPLQIAVSFALAVLYTRKAAGSKVWRSLVVLPVAAPPAVSTVIWSVIYRPSGLGNSILAIFGIPDQPFLTSTQQSLFAIIVLMSWGGVGYWMLFLIAGINDVPPELHEAASIDGASAWRRLWQITLPLVRRPLAFVLVADTVSNFLVFAPVQILTQGGPQGSTNLLMFDIYSRAYTLDDVNGADAEVILLILITLIIVAIQFRLLRNQE
jgi:multiple sugar transport system permease protein